MTKKLLENGYVRVKFKLTKTNHIEVSGKLNNVKGRFLIDTGASNSCLGFEAAKTFVLTTEPTETLAAGAGATDMPTLLSKKNHFEIGDWVYKRSHWVLFDLKHVNTALKNHGAEEVDGILGADILRRGKAVIDYKGKWLYLKR